MTSEAKRVKILTLISLFLGLVTLVLGIVLIVSGASTAVSSVVCVDGFITLVFGGRGALLANVPAKMGTLAKLAIIVFLLQVVAVAGIVFLTGPEHVGEQPLPVIASGVDAILSFVIWILARGIAKRAER